MTARQVVTYTCVYIFCVAILLLLEVALGLYLYKAVKNDFEIVFVKELRQGLCKEEFKEFLGDSNYMQQYIDEKVKTLLCKIGLCDRFQSTRQRRHTDGGYGYWGHNHHGHNGFQHRHGEPGPPGPPGPAGIPGRPGMAGSPGLKGEYGLPGDRGIEGQKGERGGSGLPGAKGDQGPQGNSGQKGDIGPQGLKGDKGERGMMGDVGQPGKEGPPGKNGAPGKDGPPGTIGLPGERGDKGEMGAPGKDGHSGPPGIPEIDPTLATPSPILDGSNIPIFGVQQPEIVPLEQLYPSPSPGPRWELSQCGNDIYPGFPNRNLDCELYAVEKPVFHGYIDMAYGSWMKDSSPANDADGEKFWITNEHEPKKLYEYDKENAYRRSNATRTYKLDIPFQGNAHVMFNGSFYYQAQGKPKIIRYFLNNETRMELDVPRLNVTSGNYLYTTENNYMDFSVDDNGLWVIFPVPDANNTAIMKVDVSSMQIQYIWNISLDHHLVGEMFVVCGVLYAIDNVTDRNTRIRFALDLYNNRLLDVNLSFKNPFRHTTMVGYNHRNKELYSLDNGNKLTYPIRYDEIGNFTIIDGKFEHNEFLNK